MMGGPIKSSSTKRRKGTSKRQVLVEQSLHGLHDLEELPTVLAHGAVESRHNEPSLWKETGSSAGKFS